VGDEVDRIGWPGRKKVASAGHEYLFRRSEANA
jgi:hypothetical protein